jgi:hypothetical protein
VAGPQIADKIVISEMALPQGLKAKYVVQLVAWLKPCPYETETFSAPSEAVPQKHSLCQQSGQNSG